MTWEFVAEGLERIEAPGGWLYRSFWMEVVANPLGMVSNECRYSAPVFVPTPVSVPTYAMNK